MVAFRGGSYTVIIFAFGGPELTIHTKNCRILKVVLVYKKKAYTPALWWLAKIKV
ncbi:hypothetical protein AGMMS49950_11020 [Endomicrobiia bacterium]|nr:hypothetical protein AGMMS49950_11020 [Endomicrobiia bacterium]